MTTDFSRPDDRFIPIAPPDLIGLIEEDSDFFGRESSRINEIAQLMARILEQERTAFRAGHRRWVFAFSTRIAKHSNLKASPNGDRLMNRPLHQKLNHLLEKANFERTDVPNSSKAAIATSNTHGLKVQLGSRQGRRDLGLGTRSFREGRSQANILTSNQGSGNETCDLQQTCNGGKPSRGMTMSM